MELTLSLFVNAALAILSTVLYFTAASSLAWREKAGESEAKRKALSNAARGLTSSLRLEEDKAIRERLRYIELRKRCTCVPRDGLLFKRLSYEDDSKNSSSKSSMSGVLKNEEAPETD